MGANRKILSLLISTSLVVIPLASNAEALQPSRENLTILEGMIAQNPHNLDYYFEYANMAIALKELAKAEKAYIAMLEANPSLDRVRLELALLYTNMERFEESKTLLNEVLSHNPPEKVKENIHKLLTIADSVLKKHRFYGSAAIGYNHDSNANSASSTGEVTVLGIDLPLEGNSRASDDGQVYAMASLGHSYRIAPLESPLLSVRWNSNGLIYRAEQATMDTLDLLVTSLKIGPSFYIKPLRTNFSVNGGYDYIELYDRNYLDVLSGQLTADYAHTNKLVFSSSLGWEHRHFVNSPDVLTYTDRTGNAYQAKFGARYALTQDDIFRGNITFRNEETRQSYYDNHYVEVEGGYLRVLPYDFFINTGTSYKYADYDGADPIIDPDIIREDKTWAADFTVGKKLPFDLTWTLGYQYKDVDSNIQNYEYDNHRVMTGVSWQFAN